jgi:hypothetical protein
MVCACIALCGLVNSMGGKFLNIKLGKYANSLKRHLKNLLRSAIVLVIASLTLAIVLPSLPRYEFASINDAKAFGHNDGAEIIVDELGDTNGPYKFVKSVVGGVGKPFDFDMKFADHITNWSKPVTNHMWFVATIFENRRGNQFAVIRKRME